MSGHPIRNNGFNPKCLTKTERKYLNKQRRLPKDLPTVKRLNRNLSQRQRKDILKDTRSTKVVKARKVFELLHRSTEAHRLVEQLRDHPGSSSSLHPMVLLAAVVCQAVAGRDYWRSEICERINGFDSQFWFEHGMCDATSRTPVSYEVVCQQLVKLEKLFKGGDDNVSEVFDRLSTELLKLSVPQLRNDAATAASVDQTAFPTFYRSTDFRHQKDIDRVFKETGEIPDDARVGADGKLVRCKDPDARAGHRSASTASGGTAGEFVGYAVSTVVMVRPTKWSGRLDESPLIAGTEVSPYIVGLSVDPASANPGEVCLQATMNARRVAPGIVDVLADRGITNCTTTFSRPLHKDGVHVTMDYKKQPNSDVNVAAKLDLMTVGKSSKQNVYVSADGFYALWTPENFLEFPDDFDEDAAIEWFEGRAAYRMVENGSFSNGSKQFLCPVHGGRVKPKKELEGFSRTPKQSAVPIDLGNKKCCEGSFTVHVESLDTYQKIPFGTRAHKLSYARRSQVENSYGCLRSHGGFSPQFCRAIGLGAHRFAALALCIANNIYFAAKDVLNRKPKLFNGCDCLKNIGINGRKPKPAAGVCNGHRLRAPP